MLTASTNILLQEEWVQRWLDKLTPKQKALVVEVLEDGTQRRKPTQAAADWAAAVVTDSELKALSRAFGQNCMAN
ncbi:MAG TPA: hypothetical protein V6C91_15340 [Coleofasciculaceae cyanobacterium]